MSPPFWLLKALIHRRSGETARGYVHAFDAASRAIPRSHHYPTRRPDESAGTQRGDSGKCVSEEMLWCLGVPGREPGAFWSRFSPRCPAWRIQVGFMDCRCTTCVELHAPCNPRVLELSVPQVIRVRSTIVPQPPRGPAIVRPPSACRLPCEEALFEQHARTSLTGPLLKRTSESCRAS